MSDNADNDRLYFRQLLSGRDFAQGDHTARQMVNFVYLIGDRRSSEALIVDPAYAVQDLLDVLAADGMKLTGVLGTHYHSDHVGGNMGGWSIEGIGALLEAVQVPVHLQKEEIPWVERTTGVTASHLVGHDSGDVVRVGSVEVELIHTPGHTPGSQCFLVDGRLVAGDTLFLEGCGRTDLPGSDPAAMYESINHRLSQVPDDAVLFPGHLYSADPSQSMGETRRNNYCLSSSFPPGVGDHVRRIVRTDGLPADGTAVVVGASLAGWRAVETLRAEGFHGDITLIGQEQHLPYDRPPLSKQVLAGTWPPEKAVLADRKRSSELRVHEVLGHRAVRLDVEARQVEIEDGTIMGGDALVLATGASPRQLSETGGLGQADGLFTLRTLDDSLALRAAVTATGSCRVIVVGAGFIGAEVASTCATLGCRVTVLEAMEVPLSNVLGPLIGAYCASLHAAHGVELRTGVAVAGIRRSDRSLGGLVVEIEAGVLLEADVVVVGIGVAPSVEWLESSGLTVDNGIVCDDRLFAADGIVAAGDVARWMWRHDGADELIRIEHWQVAAEAGVAAARSVVAGRLHAAPFVPVPYFWSDQFDIRFQVLGNPGGTDHVEIVDGSFEEGKFVALFGRSGRLRAAMAVGRPRQLMAVRSQLEAGCSWDDALAQTSA